MRRLFDSRPSRLRANTNYFQSMCDDRTVWAVQETHGSEPLMQSTLRRILRKHWAFSTFCEDTDRHAGGLITVVPALGDSSGYANWTSLVLVPGRALRIEWE